MKIKLFITTICFTFIILLGLSSKLYATGTLSFDKDVYVIDDFSEARVEMDIPEGYTKSDIIFKSDDENIAKGWYWNPFDKDDEEYDEWEKDTFIAIIAGKKIGETKIHATIEGTEYSATTNVKVENPIKIGYEKNGNDILLKIENKCGLNFIDTQYQAVDIGIRKNGGEINWERLGYGRFGDAINKTYSYTLAANEKYEIEVCWTWYDEDEIVQPGDGVDWVNNSIVIDDTNKSEKNNWKISANKENIDLSVGKRDTIDIMANLRDGLSIIQVVEMRTDYWNVEWKIEDESIAKCVPEKGIENNIYGSTQVAGRAVISGLKAGKTKLLVKVEVSNNETEEIEIPITVTGSDEKIGTNAKIKILAENNKKTLEIGETLKLSVEFLEMAKQSIIWESSDTSIATVDNDGKITALKDGTVKIKAYTEDKKYSDEYEITVKRTTSDKELPHTGEGLLFTFGIVGFILISIGIISNIKYRKLK